MDASGKKEGLLHTLKSIKHIEWIVVLLVAGAALLFIATGFPKAQEAPVQQASASAAPQGNLEGRMEATLSLIQGAGRVSVLVNREETVEASSGAAAPITGVIVVADGANDLAVRLELMRAVQSLLDVPQSNIEIFAMAKESEE